MEAEKSRTDSDFFVGTTSTLTEVVIDKIHAPVAFEEVRLEDKWPFRKTSRPELVRGTDN